MAEARLRVSWEQASWMIWAPLAGKGVSCSPSDYNPYAEKATREGKGDVLKVLADWPGATTFDASEMDGIT